MKLLIAILLSIACLAARADTINLTVSGVTNANYVVPSNVVAKVVYAACLSGGANLRVSIGTNSSIVASITGYGAFAQTNLPTVVGPSVISMANTFNGGSAWSYCVIETSPASPTPVIQTPGTAVVIPCDTNGPVKIILESSTDLVNWTEALPGTYGTTASNRFFRVRASR
jgi:hypothetical protein